MTALEQISHIAEIPIEIEVELGRKSMPLSAVLRLATGVIIKMPRLAGDNIDILAGGKVFGSGEIVIIGERIGARITDFREEN